MSGSIVGIIICLFASTCFAAYTGYDGQNRGGGPQHGPQYGYGSNPRDNYGRDYSAYGGPAQSGRGFEGQGQSHQQYARGADLEPDQKSGKESAEPQWTPVREPKQFNAYVADKIEGSHIMRSEKWNNGTMSGSYAQPLGNKKWDIITYIADDKGYRITSKKTVDESQLPEIEAAMASKEKQANINVDNNGAKTSYIVTPDQINKNKENQPPQKP